MRLTIKTKLGFAFGSILACLGATGALGVYSLSSANTQMQAFADRPFAQVQRGGELQNDMINTARLLHRGLADNSDDGKAATQINQAIQQLDKVTQQNASASEEVSSTSEQLASQADQLQSAIAFFKIGDAGASEMPARAAPHPVAQLQRRVAEHAKTTRSLAMAKPQRSRAAARTGGGFALDMATGEDAADEGFRRVS